MKNKSILIGLTLLGFIVYYFIGIFLDHILIDDECYYHSHDEPLHIYLLFDFPAYEGFHPVPTKFGYIIFGLIGYSTGHWIDKKKSKSKSE